MEYLPELSNLKSLNFSGNSLKFGEKEQLKKQKVQLLTILLKKYPSLSTLELNYFETVNDMVRIRDLPVKNLKKLSLGTSSLTQQTISPSGST